MDIGNLYWGALIPAAIIGTIGVAGLDMGALDMSKIKTMATNIGSTVTSKASNITGTVTDKATNIYQDVSESIASNAAKMKVKAIKVKDTGPAMVKAATGAAQDIWGKDSSREKARGVLKMGKSSQGELKMGSQKSQGELKMGSKKSQGELKLNLLPTAAEIRRKQLNRLKGSQSGAVFWGVPEKQEPVVLAEPVVSERVPEVSAEPVVVSERVPEVVAAPVVVSERVPEVVANPVARGPKQPIEIEMTSLNR